MNVNYTIPDDLHRALKVKAAQEGKTLKQVILEALEAWVYPGEPE
jgi:predicted HicB family RNase H-like nuclease